MLFVKEKKKTTSFSVVVLNQSKECDLYTYDLQKTSKVCTIRQKAKRQYRQYKI